MMHEYAIVASLVDAVQRVADAHPGAVVRAVRVKIGDLAGVECELLRTAFATFRARTVCDGAELAIESVPGAWRCTRCDRAIATGEALRCPSCRRPATLVAGGDIVLERVELEVRDV
jgi:hydrogenase nickel incorporation protein HypA/HybF